MPPPSPFQLLIATSNLGKFQEIQEIFEDLNIRLLSLSDLDLDSKALENGTSFNENAILKARHFYNLSRLPTLADDSGIIVDAFPGELGVYTRRWGAGALASDQEWLTHFLQKMSPFSDPKSRTATFICAAAFIDHENQLTFQGETKGLITERPETELTPGIPLSACFRPLGFEKVYSALTKSEKNRISHRGQAFQQLKNWLQTKSNLNTNSKHAYQPPANIHI